MSIRIENLSHIFMPDSPFMTTALRDINLTIEQGECVGLIGHTGSGKSTLVQHINGLLKPTSGRVLVEGIDTSAKGASILQLRRHVGLVFQYPEYQLFEESVEKDIGFGPHNMGLDKTQIAARVREALAQVGLGEDLLPRSPFDLSGGQRRRVAIAGVLAMQPNVLILDEPTAGLDPAGRNDILAMVRAIRARSGCTVLMISHSMDEVAGLVDRVLVMNQGRIAMQGTPREIFERSEQLRAIGLDVPAVAQLGEALRARGLDIPRDIVSLQDMAQCLLRLQKEAHHAR